MILVAWSRSFALRSGIFFSAISRAWSRVIVATLSRFGSPEPLEIPAACLIRIAAGGVLVMKVNERSSKTVISTGMIVPLSPWVCALKALQNSMMLTPCWPSAGPTGGAGLAFPPGTCSLMSVRTFLAISDLLHLVETDLDGRLAPEDGYQHLELGGIVVDLGDLAGEVRQRSRDHLDRLADGELGACARALGGLAVEQPVDLRLTERDGLLRRPDEAGHSRGVLDEAPRVVGQVHVDEQVARHRALLLLDLLAVLHLLDLLGGDDDLAHGDLLAERLNPVLQVLLDLLLVARVGVDGVPAEHLT